MALPNLTPYGLSPTLTMGSKPYFGCGMEG